MARWLALSLLVASTTVRATRVFELDDLITDLTPAAGFANMLTLNASLSAGDDIRVVIACPAGESSCAYPLVGGAQATNQRSVELVLGAGVTLVAQHSFSIEDHSDNYWAYRGDEGDLQYMALVQFVSTSNVTIRGERDAMQRAVSHYGGEALPSKIDGDGLAWWVRKLGGNATGVLGDPKNPSTFRIDDCDGLNVYDLYIENSPAMGIFVETSTDVRIERVAVTIESQSAWVREHITVDIWAINTDGIDVSGRDIVVRDVYVNNADDAVAIKGAKSNNYVNCTERVLIENSTLIGVGASLGSIAPSTSHTCVRDVTFRDVRMPGALKGIYVKTDNETDDTGASATIENVLYERVSVDGATWWPLWIGPQQQHNDLKQTVCKFTYPLGRFVGPARDCLAARHVAGKNVTLRDVNVTNSLYGRYGGMILGNAVAPDWSVIFDGVRVDKPIGCASATIGLRDTDRSLFVDAPMDVDVGYSPCAFYDL